MSSADTVGIPAVDTPEGALWREILAHDVATATVMPAGDGGMLVGGSALSRPALAEKVNQNDTDEGVECSTNTEVGHVAYFSLINTTPEGRAANAGHLRNDMDKYRHLAADETELALWVLYNLTVYVLALWGTNNTDEVREDLDVLHKTLAGIRADTNTV